MEEFYFRFYFQKSLIQNYRLTLLHGMYIKTFLISCSSVALTVDSQDLVGGFFHRLLSVFNKILRSIDTFMEDKYFISSILEVLPSLNVNISISCVKRENTFMTFCCQLNLLVKLIILMIRLSHICLWKTTQKVAQILVTLTSHCDFHFKCSNTSFNTK